MVTLITLYNWQTRQYYVRLHPAVLDETEKADLLTSLHAINAAEYDYDKQPVECNRLYFQEFEVPDTKGIYFNINGDRPIYDLIVPHERQIEYHI